MDILTNLEKVNKVKSLIANNKQLFEGFEEIYIFGSLLCTEKCPNDIDLLLIYALFDIDLLEKCEYISSVIELEIDLPADITMLSREEKEETRFLDLINNKHMKITL